MTAAAVAAGRSLQHVGIVSEGAEALVEVAAPHVLDALSGGADVYLGVDRRTARGFRDWLGADGDRVVYPSPTRWLRDPTRELREVVRPGRRTLVLGQYSAIGAGDEQGCHEDGINLMLADLPLTVLCSCSREAEPAVLAALHGGHPHLVVDGLVTPNPHYRPPITHAPVDPVLWGPATVRLEFRAPDDLGRLREHVAQAARAIGLGADSVREAVLAAHEAALLAAGRVDPLGPHDDPTVACLLEVRADLGVLHCEVLGPRVTTRSRDGGDPLRIVRLFCDRALIHDGVDARAVRVLSAA